jgi:hypothetical protein
VENYYKSKAKRDYYKRLPFILNFSKLSINRYVPIYLMSCFAYYCLGEPFLLDSDHDTLCKHLYEEWDNVEHIHKHLVEREALLASTGSEDPSTYLVRVKNATYNLIYLGTLVCEDTENLPTVHL